jgi:hypothetical protein
MRRANKKLNGEVEEIQRTKRFKQSQSQLLRFRGFDEEENKKLENYLQVKSVLAAKSTAKMFSYVSVLNV